MREPFFPQLAVFIASRPLLALYREFIFPSVPRTTGLLPVALEDIRTTRAENLPIAVDIALTRAAVVIYDSGQRGRLPVDYVRQRRDERPLIIVAAPRELTTVESQASPAAGEESSVSRPREMTGWPLGFVQPLLQRIASTSRQPTLSEIDHHLSDLSAKDAWSDLLLTGLSMLERRMRIEDLPTTVPLDLSHGAMDRLQESFGTDFTDVINAVALRHNLLQNLNVDEAELRRAAKRIEEVVRRRYQVPDARPAPD